MDTSGELKPCPFCGVDLEGFGQEIVRGHVHDLYRHPLSDTDCPLAILVFFKDQWNTRPIEDGLRSAQTEDRNRIKRLEVQLSKLLVLIETHGDRIMKAHASLLMRAREVLHAGQSTHPEETWDGLGLE